MIQTLLFAALFFASLALIPAVPNIDTILINLVDLGSTTQTGIQIALLLTALYGLARAVGL